jgi:hypothetical protein
LWRGHLGAGRCKLMIPPSRQPGRPCGETAATCLAVQALREHDKSRAADRLKAGALWQDHGLVFASSIGTPLDRHNVLREFRKVSAARAAGGREAVTATL